MRYLAIGIAAVYGLWLSWNALARAIGGRAVRRSQRRGGGRYTQINSVTGGTRPPRFAPTFWFLFACAAVVIYKLWTGRS